MEQQHYQAELRQIFPKMTPVDKPPGMFTLNGCGTTVYGKRDFHEATQTYIKTYFLCLVFIPIVAFGAYRVSDAESGGWYFIGKEPLSGLVRGWNYLVLSAVLVFGGFALWGGAPSKSYKRPAYTGGDKLDRDFNPPPARTKYRQAGLKDSALTGSTLKGSTPKTKQPTEPRDTFGTFLDDEADDAPKRRKTKKESKKKTKAKEKGDWLDREI